MDAVLAILVLGAVIFFGALISAGNERQRRALDGIREQAALWAMQDLRLKREKLGMNVKVDDPVTWLNKVVAKVYGEDLSLTLTEIFDNPQALVCMTNDGRKMMFSPISPKDVCKLKKKHKSRLLQVGQDHPLLNLLKASEIIEVSILNAGILFDLEMQVVWKILFDSNKIQQDILFIYIA